MASKVSSSSSESVTAEATDVDQKMAVEAIVRDQEIVLVVGQMCFTTTTAVLLGKDQDTFFHSQCSGRWEQGKSIAIERPGMPFADVLFYLRFGDIPRDPYGRSLLDEDALQQLQEEAEFYLLPGLVALCKDPSPPPQYVVIRFGVNSMGKTEISEITCFADYSDAKAFCTTEEEKLEGFKFTGDRHQLDYEKEDKIYEEDFPDRDDEYHKYVKRIRGIDQKTGLETLEAFEEGCYKRPSGVSLYVCHHGHFEEHTYGPPTPVGALMQYNLRSYPDRRTYY